MLKGVYSNQEIKPKVNNHSNIKQHTHITKPQKLKSTPITIQPIPNSTQSQISYLYANSAQPPSQTSKTKQPQQINSNKKRDTERVCVYQREWEIEEKHRCRGQGKQPPPWIRAPQHALRPV